MKKYVVVNCIGNFYFATDLPCFPLWHRWGALWPFIICFRMWSVFIHETWCKAAKAFLYTCVLIASTITGYANDIRLWHLASNPIVVGFIDINAADCWVYIHVLVIFIEVVKCCQDCFALLAAHFNRHLLWHKISSSNAHFAGTRSPAWFPCCLVIFACVHCHWLLFLCLFLFCFSAIHLHVTASLLASVIHSRQLPLRLTYWHYSQYHCLSPAHSTLGQSVTWQSPVFDTPTAAES